MKLTIALALFGAANAFTMAPRGRHASVLSMSKYDGQVWDFDAMKDVYDGWNPDAQRDENNFNPFEKNKDGNQCDANGYYPGEGRYKDPIRGDTDFMKVMKEQELLKEIRANPKPGDRPGAPGCKN